MKKFIKKINLAFLLFFTLSLSYSQAKETNCIENHCCYECQCPNGQGFINAELLYWRAFQDGLDTCIPTQETNTVLSDGRIVSTFEGKGRDPHFEWNPGFRISGGFEFNCSNWNLLSRWTHFNSNANNSRCHANRLRWKIDLDIIDVLSAYQYDFNPCFSLTPFVGIRIGRINQKLHLAEIPNNTSFSSGDGNIFGTSNKHKFIGVGPLFGLEADLNIACGFSIYINGAISWLYGRNNVRLTNSTASESVIDFSNITRKTSSTLLTSDANIGFRWQTCFCNGQQLFLQLGYDHHRYFDYSRFGGCGDLSFDGVSFGAGLSF